jgi:hypothetical protein
MLIAFQSFLSPTPKNILATIVPGTRTLTELLEEAVTEPMLSARLEGSCLGTSKAASSASSFSLLEVDGSMKIFALLN